MSWFIIHHSEHANIATEMKLIIPHHMGKGIDTEIVLDKMTHPQVDHPQVDQP